MKIIHTSDWHLGRSFGPISLQADQEAFCDHFVDLAATEAADRVVMPDRVNVISTLSPEGPTGVPDALPEAPGASVVSCHPKPGTVLHLGWSTVACEAISSQGTTVDTFPLVVKPVSGLASSGSATSGGAWRAVGVGYAPGSPVGVEISGHEVASGKAGADGRVSIDFAIPASVMSGNYQLVVRGVDGKGDPLLTVGALTVIAAPPGTTPPTNVPGGAPKLPGNGPAVPADPGPPPLPPEVGHVPMNTNPTTTSTTSMTVALPPDGATTTTPPGGTAGGPDGPGGKGGSGDHHGAAGSPSSQPSGVSLTRLPATGADIAAWLAIGAALVAAGFVLLRFQRRREAVES